MIDIDILEAFVKDIVGPGYFVRLTYFNEDLRYFSFAVSDKQISVKGSIVTVPSPRCTYVFKEENIKWIPCFMEIQPLTISLCDPDAYNILKREFKAIFK